jgi:hypothetical protein
MAKEMEKSGSANTGAEDKGGLKGCKCCIVLGSPYKHSVLPQQVGQRLGDNTKVPQKFPIISSKAKEAA